jgi:hypothetical protein
MLAVAGSINTRLGELRQRISDAVSHGFKATAKISGNLAQSRNVFSHTVNFARDDLRADPTHVSPSSD